MLWAISDLHTGHTGNKPVTESLYPASPDDWRAWYRLGLAYDASGDRRRAREAVRRAITLEADSRR